jgi:hypothetical protein
VMRLMKVKIGIDTGPLLPRTAPAHLTQTSRWVKHFNVWHDLFTIICRSQTGQRFSVALVLLIGAVAIALVKAREQVSLSHW